MAIKRCLGVPFFAIIAHNLPLFTVSNAFPKSTKTVFDTLSFADDQSILANSGEATCIWLSY